MKARRAVLDDASELVRLRGVMLADVHGNLPGPGPWQEIALQTLRERLAEGDGSLGAFVVDRDHPGGLAACALGVIERRLGDPGNPSGDYGYVFNVATDPGCRRRGYARACMEALLEWYGDRGVRKIDLRTSQPGEPLYRSLGFVDSRYPAMRLLLP